MSSKPLQGLLGHLFECSRFFEQMCGPSDDRELLGTAEKAVRLLIHLDDGLILAADQEQCRRAHLSQVPFGKVRASAARDDGTDRKVGACGGLQGGAGPRTGAKVAQREMFR